jgi:hypothetical protein
LSCARIDGSCLPGRGIGASKPTAGRVAASSARAEIVQIEDRERCA